MRRFICSAGILVTVAVTAAQLVTGQFSNDPHFSGTHQRWMLIVLGLAVLGFLTCSHILWTEHWQALRPEAEPSPPESSSSSTHTVYNYEVDGTAEVPAFLSRNAPQPLPGSDVPEEWPVDRKPPGRIAQHERLRLV